MLARDIMTTGALTVTPHAPIADAARLMLDHHISGLPVADQGGALVGIVTERDLLCRPEIGTAPRHEKWIQLWLTTDELAAEYVQSRGRTVGEVMTRQVVSITPDTPLDKIVSLMIRDGMKRLPVVQDGKVIGIVSRADLLRGLAARLDSLPEAKTEDLAVRGHILREIRGKRWVSRPIVNVAVCDGIVELTGSVASEIVRDAIRVAAENAPGAKQVIDHLSVVPRASGSKGQT
ncbi:CBS domain-containing protein [Mesorhizobium sp.]|uniref:CBS domain-containing protein n=1 Tax=Mesorhizobium sp. TaxID=1871066 RepID=UPI000FE61BDA|nr:CBS domain-containing protein [Mesorhizobium sp.]RWM22769.1 MAG: CBS domain-containing protein [Mesorhizobium sp.]RWM33757.1 MAG: CBS domain-containing protein [Mesorhizobium sp.]TIO74292.1 MAG: CBS domain-containing protein [Mesorhizobium sp.]TIO82171.1 MAG: CBS domain-containing protein [Mesorhizobium sp.]TJV49182.1 MAG: CBS domain-containing protein [Mesorhizobium sp.]